MPNKKIDWSKVKLDFFLSNFVEIKRFLYKSWIDYDNAAVKHRVKWRDEEKQEHSKKIFDKLLIKHQEEIEESQLLEREILLKWKRNALVWIIKDLSDKDKELSITERIKWLNALKLELWEPLKYIPSMIEKKDEELSEEDKALLDKFINERDTYSF